MSTVELVVALILTIFITSSTQDEDRFTIKFEDKIFDLINVTEIEEPLNTCKDSLSSYYPNYSHFLSADLRISICEKAYEINDQKFEIHFYPKCFEEQTLVKRNPCAVVCINKPRRNNIDDTRKCDNVANNKNRQFFLTGARCGEHHFCDKNGCCVDETAITPTTTSMTTTTPILIETPTTTPVLIETPTTTPIPIETPTATSISIETPTTTSTPTMTPETPPTPTTTFTPITGTTSKPVPTKRHVCDHPGYSIFKANRRFYFFCKFYATIHHCGTNNKFNGASRHCEYDRSTPDPALEFEKWRDAVKCLKFNTYIRSPYNCKFYYTCEKDTEHGQRIFYNVCPGGLVFNETSQNCDYKTKKCNNRLEVP